MGDLVINHFTGVGVRWVTSRKSLTLGNPYIKDLNSKVEQLNASIKELDQRIKDLRRK
jgi:cell division protein FtsL